MYAEQIGEIKAKTVEYHGLRIQDEDSNIISSTSEGSFVASQNIGVKLIGTTSNTTGIYVSATNPDIFYSARNEYNSFAANEDFKLKITYDLDCHSGYIDENKYMYDKIKHIC